MAAQGDLERALGRLMSLTEAYPTLKADANMTALMEELTATENRIAFARQHYNEVAQAQNDRIGMFPANLLARPFGFGPVTYFRAPEGDAIATAPTVRF